MCRGEREGAREKESESGGEKGDWFRLSITFHDNHSPPPPPPPHHSHGLKRWPAISGSITSVKRCTTEKVMSFPLPPTLGHMTSL